MSEITPALTKDEWEEIQAGTFDPYSMFVEYENPRGVAAFCLYGQENGFTHADVDDLREMAEAVDALWGAKMPGAVTVDAPGGRVQFFAQWADSCRSLADRIAALLPPEE